MFLTGQTNMKHITFESYLQEVHADSYEGGGGSDTAQESYERWLEYLLEDGNKVMEWAEMYGDRVELDARKSHIKETEELLNRLGK